MKTIQELQEACVAEVLSRTTKITDDSEGSILDAISGAVAFTVSEIQRILLDRFNATFFDTANGPATTGGVGTTDDLRNLAVDHFGDDFERPGALKSNVVMTFSRSSAAAGACLIPTGTIIKTTKDADGEEIRFETTDDATLTSGGGSDLTVDVSADAVVGGSAGNVGAGTIEVIESALTDSTVVCTNASAAIDGNDTYQDAAYREYIKNTLATFRQAIATSIEAAALTIPGIVSATALEVESPVALFDPATQQIDPSVIVSASGPRLVRWFYLPHAKLYIADATGAPSDAQVGLVADAIGPVKAFGVYVEILKATGQALNWSLVVTLDAGGAHYADFQAGDFTIVESWMAAYINAFAIGDGFDAAAALTAVKETWGIVAIGGDTDGPLDFADVTSPNPSVSGAAGVKLYAGTMAVS